MTINLVTLTVPSEQHTGLMFSWTEHGLVVHTLCLRVGRTYVIYMLEAAVALGTVGELAFVPLETNWTTSESVG